MALVALYDMRYGRPGPRDAEAAVIRRGETFDARPTAQASAVEVERYLIAAGVAATPEDWARRKPCLLPQFRPDGSIDWAPEARD